jgi:hypothetical protein
VILPPLALRVAVSAPPLKALLAASVKALPLAVWVTVSV